MLSTQLDIQQKLELQDKQTKFLQGKVSQINILVRDMEKQSFENNRRATRGFCRLGRQLQKDIDIYHIYPQKFYKQFNFFRIEEQGGAACKMLVDHPFTSMLIIQNFLKGNKSKYFNVVEKWPSPARQLEIQQQYQQYLQLKLQESEVVSLLVEFWTKHIVYDESIKQNIAQLFIQFVLSKQNDNIFLCAQKIKQIIKELVQGSLNNHLYQFFSMLFGISGQSLLNLQDISVLRQFTTICLKYRIQSESKTQKISDNEELYNDEQQFIGPEMLKDNFCIEKECQQELLNILDNQEIRILFIQKTKFQTVPIIDFLITSFRELERFRNRSLENLIDGYMKGVQSYTVKDEILNYKQLHKILSANQLGTHEFITYFLYRYLEQCNEGIKQQQIVNKDILKVLHITKGDPFLPTLRTSLINFFKMKSFQCEIWPKQEEIKANINKLIKEKLQQIVEGSGQAQEQIVVEEQIHPQDKNIQQEKGSQDDDVIDLSKQIRTQLSLQETIENELLSKLFQRAVEINVDNIQKIQQKMGKIKKIKFIRNLKQ